MTSGDTSKVSALLDDHTEWSKEWSNPVLSLAERDRRWTHVRQLMREAQLDVLCCLPWTTRHDYGQANSRHLTQLGENSDETSVVFPLNGDVTAWHSRGGAWPSSSWLHDLRSAPRGSGGRTVLDRLRELGLEKATVGICDLSGPETDATLREGGVNWNSVRIIKEGIPDAKIVSASNLMTAARMVKSQEEISFLSHAALIADETILAGRRSLRPGVPERVVWAEMLRKYAILGGSYEPIFGWRSRTESQRYNRTEQPSLRVFNEGDALTLEVESRYGGYISRTDRTFHLGTAGEGLRESAGICEAVLAMATRTLAAGTSIARVLSSCEEESARLRGSAQVTLRNCGTGCEFLASNERPALVRQSGDVELREGNVIFVGVEARRGDPSDLVQAGFTSVITQGSAHQLGPDFQVLTEV